MKQMKPSKIMVNKVPIPHSPSRFTQPIEHRVVFRNLSWQAYETILENLGENRSSHLHYYKGTLEIMAPLEEHEQSSCLINDFVKVLTEEKKLNIKSLQSTTLNKPELAVGAEPDQCYYLANEPLVRGKKVDLAIDPPPDLVIEVDIIHTDVNKNALYAIMGVPEFWQYNGDTLQIYQLEEGQYTEVAVSPNFPFVPKERLYEFIQDCSLYGETVAKQRLRHSIRTGD